MIKMFTAVRFYAQAIWTLLTVERQAKAFVQKHGERPTEDIEEILLDWIRMHRVRQICQAGEAAEILKILLVRYLRDQYPEDQVRALDQAIAGAALLGPVMTEAEVGLIRIKVWASVLSLPGAPILPLGRLWDSVGGWLIDFTPGPGRYQDPLTGSQGLPSFQDLIANPDQLRLGLDRPLRAGGEAVFDNIRLRTAASLQTQGRRPL